MVGESVANGVEVRGYSTPVRIYISQLLEVSIGG